MNSEPTDAAELLKAGLSHHRAGRLAEAEACYRRVLAAEPDHAGALHLLGGIALQVKRYDLAVELISQAIKRDGSNPIYFSNLGVALEHQDKLDQAAAAYRQAIHFKPDRAEAHFNLGTVLKKQNRRDEALASYDAALALRPDHAETHNNRGVALLELKRPEEALSSFDKALALKPEYAEAFNNRGIALEELKRPDEALASYDKAVVLKPDYADAFGNRGNVLGALKRLDEALASYDKALSLKPDDADTLNNRGNALKALKRFDEALASYDKALALKPDRAAAFGNRGVVLKELKRLDEALASFDKAVALKPDYAEAFNNRGNALEELKRPDEALASFDKALALKPGSADAFINRGNVLRELNRLDEALASYDRALALKPDADAFSNRGVALMELDRLDEAVASYDKALALRPDDAEVLHNRGHALFEMSRLDEALANYDKALAIKPDFAEARIDLGKTLAALHRADEAIDCYRRVLAAAPGMAEAHSGLGNLLQTLGRLAESRQSLETAVRLAPGNAEYYRSLVQTQRIVPGDPYLDAMEELAGDMATLSNNEQIALHFALGKAYADLDKHQSAFDHLLKGNALKRKQVRYDETAGFAIFDRVKAVFTPQLMQQKRGLGDPSDVPVFILGMPRSGTTLTEQTLASHPNIFGAGELRDLATALEESDRQDPGVAPFPDVVPHMSGAQLRQFGARYVSAIRPLAPTAVRITDKMPGNFVFVGLIHLALPHARIIHTRRDPIDTCLSCFSQEFASGLDWSYDLGELGRYYRQYEALMAHWRRVLPAGVMLEVQYEELVADFEPQARRIVAHCGLEWDERCLAFHETQRPVRTASATQVRQPVYRSAVGRSRAYEPWLGPLFDALGSHVPR